MDDNKYADYLEILELEEEASLAEVKVAYKRLKKLYTAEAIESIVLEPLDDEFHEHDKQNILKSIEEAYEALSHYIKEKNLHADTPISKSSQEDKSAPDSHSIETETDQSESPDREEVEVLDLPDVSEFTEPPSSPKLEDTVVEIPEEQPPATHAEPFQLIEHDHDAVETESEPLLEAEGGDTVEMPDDIQQMAKDHSFSESQTAIKLDPSKTTPAPPETEERVYKGRMLRKCREERGMGIHELAISTKIHYRILVNIEKERYEELPEGGYVRWIVTTYAKALSLDPQKVAEDYMKRYRKWQRHQGQFV